MSVMCLCIQARLVSDNLEQAYADKMETAMQEMAEQLSGVCQ